ncbi:MAG: 23S rRNA (guanosine-2'-O-)-methyltransferase RlmB [Chlamydiae bacterium]|nr:23S rRNA (guanosine-2'-O-)-methyltransferase RlmB [Chlamydiota bacterium]
MGRHAIEEVLKATPERLLKVYSHKKDDPLLAALQRAGVKILNIPKPKLFSLVHSESHQGFVAEVRERNFLTAKEFLLSAPEKSLVVMCDSISDPQNFGTILRASECFGVDALIFSKNRNVALTPVVSKASVGGSELVPLIQVSNLADTLKKFQKAGYFALAAELGAENIYTFDFPEQTLLILGAEGVGIQPLLSKNADFHVEIPMYGQIDSLNVSQATAVLLSHWRRG